MSNQFKILELFEVLDNLKHLKRTGWVHFQVPEPESVASHMYRMAVLAMTLAQKVEKGVQNGNALDVVRCVKMALVHDIAEAIVGDITPRCGVTGDEKFQLEHQALKKITSFVPSWIGAEWSLLWQEYEEAKTPEARAVKQLDKVDMLAQARTYETKYGIDLSEFFDSTPPTTFTTQPFIEWAEEIRQNRPVLANNTQSSV